ncbi:hypothetical protein [Microbacterium sp.]|uniref:hypothetical protein n=1 Tax=Microbacterium sp. TaxID=51671 RepID=UPI00334012EB
MSGTVLAGVALRTVEVPDGTPMSGFAARTSGSAGVHDPLTVRALVIGGIALVAVDCCALHERTCEEVRTGLRAEGVVAETVLHATHTHAGPCISRERLGIDAPAVREAVGRAILEAVREAVDALLPCTLSFTEAGGTGVARNRRHLDREIDPPVQEIGFDHEGRRLATLVSYPCHPVVLDASNTLISGDFVAPLRDRVEAGRAGGVCMFLTGAAGDVNTGHSAEASFVAGGEGRTFDEAARVAGVLAEALLAAEGVAVTADEPRFAAAEVHLDLERVSAGGIARDVRAWRAELASGTARTALLEEWLRWADELPADPAASWTGRVSVIACGSLRIVALPGEPFLVAADRLRACHDGPMIVLGYCDGVPGYLPDEAEYAHGGYEVADAHRYYAMPAPFARGSLERVVSAAETLLAGLRR